MLIAAAGLLIALCCILAALTRQLALLLTLWRSCFAGRLQAGPLTLQLLWRPLIVAGDCLRGMTVGAR